ncbi:hypothetical protein VZT92_018039 [Zoarces viviparus]|uniref:Uncharacterized protein n=1 Tax=Zoarces viviparus TaxID=48416 RepID=A0AAW1EPM4_ZOAVI
MSASPELTHYLSLPPSVHRMHLLETPALNKLRRWGGGGWQVVRGRAGEGGGGFVVLNVAVKSDSNVENRLKRFILILRGSLGVKTRKECTVTDLGPLKQRLTRPGSSTHLVATTTTTQTRAEAERSRFTFCRLGEKPRARPPPAVFLPLFGSLTNTPPPPPTPSPPQQPPCRAGAVRGGGGDLPACIWLTGDWEGALRAHVTINNPC